MKLKEVERYRNMHQGTIQKLCDFLEKDGDANRMIIREEHRRKETDPQAENEVIVRDPTEKNGFSVDEMLIALERLIDEQERLEQALAYAKLRAEIDIDREEEIQKLRERFCDWLTELRTLEEKKETRPQTGYFINNKGEVSEYQYDVEITETPLFSQETICAYLRSMRQEKEEWRAKIEQCREELDVDFQPVIRMEQMEGSVREIVIGLRNMQESEVQGK